MKLATLLAGMTIPFLALGCGAGDEPTSAESQELTLPGFPDGGPFALPPLPTLPTGFPLPARPDGGFALPPLPTGFPVPILPDGGFTLPPLPTGLPVPVLPTGFPQLPPLPTGFPLPQLPDGGLFFLPPIPGVP